MLAWPREASTPVASPSSARMRFATATWYLTSSSVALIRLSLLTVRWPHSPASTRAAPAEEPRAAGPGPRVLDCPNIDCLAGRKHHVERDQGHRRARPHVHPARVSG